MIDVVCLGEILIDMVSTQRNVTLFDAPAFEPKPGGSVANVAVGVRRLGKSVAFIGKVGQDDFGRGLRRLLEQEDIDTSSMVDDPDHMTTLALVSLSDKGDPHFVFHTGSAMNLQPADLNADLIRSARIFHCASVMLSREPGRSATLEGLRLAKSANALCSYDVNWRPALWSDHQAALELIKKPLALVDILKMNAGELRLLTGEDDVDKALVGLDVPAALVVITMGEKGCLYRFNGKICHEGVTPVEVVDATGAGDAFMAALLAGLHMPLEEAALSRLMRRACRAGAITATRRGAIPGLPYLADLKDYEL